MRKKIIFYAHESEEKAGLSLDKARKKKNTCLPHAFVRKILFSFSWYIFIHKPIDLKLEKWLPLKVRVVLLKYE